MEKPKRSIIGWWQGLEIAEKAFGIFVLAMLGILFTVVALIQASSQNRAELRNHAPCSELGGWTVDNLPARCYEYYGLKIQGNSNG